MHTIPHGIITRLLHLLTQHDNRFLVDWLDESGVVPNSSRLVSQSRVRWVVRVSWGWALSFWHSTSSSSFENRLNNVRKHHGRVVTHDSWHQDSKCWDLRLNTLWKMSFPMCTLHANRTWSHHWRTSLETLGDPHAKQLETWIWVALHVSVFLLRINNFQLFVSSFLEPYLLWCLLWMLYFCRCYFYNMLILASVTSTW